MESKFNRDRREDEGYDEYGYDEPTRHQSRKTEEQSEGSLWDLVFGTPEQKTMMWQGVKKELGESFESAKSFVPGFFAPYTSKKEFGLVAATPLGLPLASGLVTCGAALTAAGAALTALGSLVFAAGYSLDGLRKGHEASKEKAHDALMVAAKAGIIAAVCAVVTVAAALLTIITGPIAFAYLTTRSLATGFAKVSELASSCSSKEEHDSGYTGPTYL
ncbi:hypothetical protein LEAN103870_04355 [Legionella anisa]|uniref:Uncharacterized protein n=1 Tax=Legionella anisa TaxID=28082 RepID=A0AAX0WYV0_9GAMM|nr:hypothetical protein [Legionella anisa]AWN72910.1 hypothetical protein DLD14_03115 [Legionella anisa]KTC70637.1 hypothetical protein Lani_2184 [Legionella anisa]MBN5936504.1 hypothetical protein [Legionella anisa]MCW8423720.1 hypothetical protein [Legionella anisa]MCW8447240.1 hypothetical protein [Legionella anisa]